ncbi:hypothetical protein DFJ74DRAFT_646582 [Hyaloraphidium curvatum]|nr:hypothetical protein DFJ74DRAFT_646582 [Hyaloraphidium curvatum]
MARGSTGAGMAVVVLLALLIVGGVIGVVLWLTLPKGKGKKEEEEEEEEEDEEAGGLGADDGDGEPVDDKDSDGGIPNKGPGPLQTSGDDTLNFGSWRWIANRDEFQFVNRFTGEVIELLPGSQEVKARIVDGEKTGLAKHPDSFAFYTWAIGVNGEQCVWEARLTGSRFYLSNSKFTHLIGGGAKHYHDKRPNELRFASDYWRLQTSERLFQFVHVASGRAFVLNASGEAPVWKESASL